MLGQQLFEHGLTFALEFGAPFGFDSAAFGFLARQATTFIGLAVLPFGDGDRGDTGNDLRDRLGDIPIFGIGEFSPDGGTPIFVLRPDPDFLEPYGQASLISLLLLRDVWTAPVPIVAGPFPVGFALGLPLRHGLQFGLGGDMLDAVGNLDEIERDFFAFGTPDRTALSRSQRNPG